MRALLAVLVVVPLGFLLKYYSGPVAWWANNWGASFCYEIFFMLLAFLVIPRRQAVIPIAWAVCSCTIILEFLQLSSAPWLQAIRSTRLGALLIGTTFSWWDLPAYPLGCLGGWLLLRTFR